MTNTPEKQKRRAVVDGALVYVSVTQMQKADEATGGCPRQWWFRYVLGLPDKPPGKGARRGDEGHKRIAEYLTKGTDVLDPLEALGKRHMPAPKSHSALVEHPVEGGLSAMGVPVVGFIDLVEVFAHRITDWKFKSKRTIRDYPTRAEDLRSPTSGAGIQMLAYGAWAASASEVWPIVTLRHVVFQTEGPREVFPIEIAAPVDLINNSWQSVTERIIPTMKDAAKAPTAFDVKPNHAACSRYGGCPYAATCLDPMARIKAGLQSIADRKTKKDENMGMLSSIIGNKNGVSIPSNAPVQAPTPAPPPAIAQVAQVAQPPAPAPAKALIQDEKPSAQIPVNAAVQGQQYNVNGVDATFLCYTSYGAQRFGSFMPIAGGMPMLVPQDQLIGAYGPPPPAPVQTPVASPPAPVAQVAPAPVQAPVQAQPPVPPPPPAAEAKKGRGRPRKTTAEATEGGAGTSGTLIYSGCAPVGVQTTNLLEYVEELQEKLYEAIKKADPTFAPPYTEAQTPQNPHPASDLRLAEGNIIGFGKWKAYLSGVAQEFPPAPGHYVALKGDDRVDTVVAALSRALPAGSVVLG